MANLKTRTYEAMGRFAIAHAADLQFGDFDGWHDAYESMVHQANSMTPKVREWLSKVCEFTCDDEGITYDPQMLDTVDNLTDVLSAEYEAIQDIRTTWTAFGLSGDDDVDYNGGYINAITEVLRLMDKGSDI